MMLIGIGILLSNSSFLVLFWGCKELKTSNSMLSYFDETSIYSVEAIIKGIVISLSLKSTDFVTLLDTFLLELFFEFIFGD